MPIKIIKQFTAWSFSRLIEYEECPFKAHQKHILKNTEPDKPVFQRGRDIEAEAYRYIFDKKPVPLPASCQAFPDEFKFMRKNQQVVLSQRDMAFDQDWRPVDWFAPNAWVRIKIDLLLEELAPGSKKHWRIHVVDLKTGRIYEDKLDQLDLYNLAALCLGDEIITHGPQVSFAEMWYLDHGETRERSLFLTDVAKAKAYWAKRVKPLFADKSFLPRPGMHCKWCHLSKNKGGPCPY
jgi:hypothetical protein